MHRIKPVSSFALSFMFSGTPGTLAESTALYSRDFSDEEF
jgi:hypothetical protein